MKKIKVIKRRNEVCLFFPELRDVDKIANIMKLFNVEYLYGECFLNSNDELTDDIFQNTDVKISIFYNRRKHRKLIIGVPQKLLKDFVGITEKFDTTLEGYAGSIDDWDYFLAEHKLQESNIIFVINDNDGSVIRFQPGKYDKEKILSEIQIILN